MLLRPVGGNTEKGERTNGAREAKRSIVRLSWLTYKYNRNEGNYSNKQGTSKSMRVWKRMNGNEEMRKDI